MMFSHLKLKQEIVAFVLLLVSARLLLAATYYANGVTGSDAANGSILTPWLTWTHSISNMTDGDVLNCQGTIYAPSVNVISQYVFTNNNITINGYGTNYILDIDTLNQNTLNPQYEFAGNSNNITWSGTQSTNVNGIQWGGVILLSGNGNFVHDFTISNLHGITNDLGGDVLVCIMTLGNYNVCSNYTISSVNDGDIHRAWGAWNKFYNCVVTNCYNNYYQWSKHADFCQYWNLGGTTCSFSNEFINCTLCNSTISGGALDASHGGVLNTTNYHDNFYINLVAYNMSSQAIQNHTPDFHIINGSFRNWPRCLDTWVTEDTTSVTNSDYENCVFDNCGLLASYGTPTLANCISNTVVTNCLATYQSATVTAMYNLLANNPIPSSGWTSGGSYTAPFQYDNVYYTNTWYSNMNLTITSTNSPLHDAGVNLYVINPFDFIGNPRPSSGAFDAGAYEYMALAPASVFSITGTFTFH